ncbi:Uncharacterized protein dnm_016030 [Desulfonema magnum]|uniref:Uncharacterized protein n=1 Tax=Desulfonema magnum TaxID=45655 RepID=A0A975BHN3_9BACT|nr:Uncharacterized protein dnm_016030 [Desulfonema magnum]
MVLNFGFQVSSFEFQVLSFEFQVSSFKFRVPSSKFQVSSFEFQVSSSEFQVPFISSFKTFCICGFNGLHLGCMALSSCHTNSTLSYFSGIKCLPSAPYVLAG